MKQSTCSAVICQPSGNELKHDSKLLECRESIPEVPDLILLTVSW